MAQIKYDNSLKTVLDVEDRKAVESIEAFLEVFSYVDLADKKTRESPVYVMPIKMTGNVTNGYFNVDDKLGCVPLVFYRQKGSGTQRDYYGFDASGKIVGASGFGNNCLNLELFLTKEHESSLFNTTLPSLKRVYGIKGAYGLCPLLLAYETQEGYSFMGFARNDDGNLLPYIKYPSDYNSIERMLNENFYKYNPTKAFPKFKWDLDEK